MNWALLLQGIDTGGVIAILIMIGGVYREHKIMWRWFERNQIDQHEHMRSRAASAGD